MATSTKRRVIETQGMLFDVAESTATAGSDCGANAPGGGGFQPGNSCGGKDGGAGGDAIQGGGAYTKKGRMEAFTREIREAAEKVKVNRVAVLPTADPIAEDDYDAIEESLDSDSRDELKDYMREKRDEAAEYYREYALDDVSKSDVWSRAGWDSNYTANKVEDLVQQHFSQDTANSLKQWISDNVSSHDDWYGDDGIAMMVSAIVDRNAASVEWDDDHDDVFGFESAMEELMDEAKGEYESARQELENEAVDEFEWDSESENDVKREWLSRYYRDHKMHFRGDMDVGEWYVTPTDSALRFTTSGGNVYDIQVHSARSQSLGVDVHDIGFYDSKGSFAVTGAGSAYEVFSHVMKNVTAYADFHNPTAMTFMAKEPSRRRLYDRVVKSLAAVMPEYSAMYTEDENWRYYAIVKRDKRDEAKEALKTHRKTEPTVLVEQWTEMEPRCDWKWRVSEAFCPTGKDGGVDNSCPPNRDNGTSSSSAASPTVNPKVESWAKEKFGDESKAKAFAKWFGDSKVVDEDGKPLVVYHGTQSRFDEFKPSDGTQGIYFTPNPEYASQYASLYGDDEGASVMPVHVKIANPKVEFIKKAAYLTPEMVKSYQADGFDGLLVAPNWNPFESSSDLPDMKDVEEVIVFASHQIKSATGNKGTFSPDSPKITEAFCPTGEGGGVKNDCEPENKGNGRGESSAKSSKSKRRSKAIYQTPQADFIASERKLEIERIEAEWKAKADDLESQLRQANDGTLDSRVADNIRGNTGQDPETFYREQIADMNDTYQRRLTLLRDRRAYNWEAKVEMDHAKAVKRAVEAGKDVPQEVLQSYWHTEWMPKAYKDKVAVESRLVVLRQERDSDKAKSQAASAVEALQKSRDAAEDIRQRVTKADAEHRRKIEDIESRMLDLHQEGIAAMEAAQKARAEAGDFEGLSKLDVNDPRKKRYDGEIERFNQFVQRHESLGKEVLQLRMARAREVWKAMSVTKGVRPVVSASDDGLSMPPEVEEFLSTVMNAEVHGETLEVALRTIDPAVRPNHRERAYYNNGAVHVSPNDSAAVHVHELGHAIEDRNGAYLGGLSKGFFWHQTRLDHGKESHLGANYDLDEVYSPDHFRDPYAGKWYYGNSTEILSMGMQALFEDPAKFAQESPEHFRYTVAVLHGLIPAQGGAS